MGKSIVFSGGGVKGIAYIGALKAFEEAGISFDRFAGTSIGSFFAALCAAGYKSDELRKILNNTNLRCLGGTKKKNILSPVNSAISLIDNKGLYNIENFYSLVDELLKRKNICTFKDLELKGKVLKIITADITSRQMIILPDDLYKYNVSVENFSVALAVTMSSALPFYFMPVQFLGHYFVDGGIVDNFPLDIFSDSLGLLLVGKEPTSTKSLIQYVSALFDTLLKSGPNSHDVDKKNVIKINVSNVTATSFDIGNEKIEELIEEGYNKTKEYIKKMR